MKKFIVFDGMDGAGKGEMISRLKKYLEDKGEKVLVTKEPTDGEYGKQIQEILKKEKNPLKSAEKLLTLFVQDREEHVVEMEKFEGIVICDRYYYSTIAFQGAQGIDVEKLIGANINFKTPDIAFILDLDPELAMERIGKRGDPKEKFEELEFMKQLRDIYLQLENALDDPIVIIDASGSIEEVFEQIKKEVEKV